MPGEPGDTDGGLGVDVGAQPQSLKNADPKVLELIREVEHAVGKVANSGFDKRPPELPQADRAASSPDLPKVKSSAFKRVIR
ncbi:MAG: hypothetical protein QM723_18515 [Myxococcaceae bacterium]